MKKSIITLTTDFGLSDPYVGAMKGSLLSINPDASIIDITHLVPPGGVTSGAMALEDACGYFPKGTIHVCVVDPGVGGRRQPILIEAGGHFFIGPDNGVLTLAAQKSGIKTIIHLTEKRFFLKNISPTFHGRDVFCPAAAHLGLGARPARFGPRIKSITQLVIPAPLKTGPAVSGEVLHVDRFGNLITNVRSLDLPASGLDRVTVRIKRVLIKGVKTTYCDAPEDSPVALINSSGRLEVAVNRRSAADILRAKAGDRVVVRLP